VQRQEEDCRALAARKGWQVYKVYIDNDTSAYKTRKRPEWEKLLADIRSGRVNCLIGWHVDRLTRRPAELESLIDMAAEYRLQLGTVAGDIDLATPMGQLVARNLGAIARYESQHKGARVARQQEQAAKNGDPVTRGPRCFGYNRDGTVNPDEARHLRDAVAGVLAGDSVYKWVNILNARGVKTTRGGPWSQSVLKKLLKNPRLAGKRVHKGEIVADGKWEPIVTMNEHTRLNALVSKPGNTWPSGAKETTRQRTYLLTGGIAVCGNCGKPLQPKPSDAGNRAYACRKGAPSFGCGTIRIAAQPLEDDVAVRVLGRLATPKVMSKLQAAMATSEETGIALADEIGQIQDKLRELGVMYAQKEIGATAFKAAERNLEDQLRSLRRQVVEASRLDTLPELTTPEDLAHWWENDSTVQERHDLVATLIDEVRIGPASRRGFRGFDPDRVTYVWRAG
jgi:DNA invertase Pin-like site-specific DNA recombinase